MKQEHAKEMERILRCMIEVALDWPEINRATRRVLSAIDAEAKGEKVRVERDGDTVTIKPVDLRGNSDFMVEVVEDGGEDDEFVKISEFDNEIWLTNDRLRWLRDHGINAALEAMDGKPVPTPATKPPLGVPAGEISQEHAREMYDWMKEMLRKSAPTSVARSIIRAIESSWPKPWVDCKGNVAEVGMGYWWTCRLSGIKEPRFIKSVNNDRIVNEVTTLEDREYFRTHCELFRIVPVEAAAERRKAGIE